MTWFILAFFVHLSPMIPSSGIFQGTSGTQYGEPSIVVGDCRWGTGPAIVTGE